MDEARHLSPSSSTPRKTTISPSNANNLRLKFETTSVIQQSDVSSSRPTLLAHDALGSLLFEALDGFFFTINHNFELDFVSDNVAQYLKFSQEELCGRHLQQCVHPNDVPKFSKAWTKKDSGDNLNNINNGDQTNAQSSRGRTFLCRIRTKDDSTTYCVMVVSVAVHRESPSSDKSFLICIARRPSSNDPKEKPAVLGFDQFSSRVNLNFDVESFDASHMKCETIDPNITGRNFRDHVHSNDVKSVESHFQEVIEEGEAKSSVYRFRLHDDTYAFVNTRSKLFSNALNGKSDSIVSTHTIVRLVENSNDLNGNAATRLTKSIIASNRDLQRNRTSNSNKTMTNSSSTPIGTHFAMAMLGMHKNASNALQQHVSSTLGTLIQVQSSFSTPNVSSPNDKSQVAQSIDLSSPSQNRSVAQKPTLIDNVSSSDTVEFSSKQKPTSPSFESTHSNANPATSPLDSLDIFLPSSTPTSINSYEPNFFLASPAQAKTSTGGHGGNELYNTLTSNSKTTHSSSNLPSQARSSTRLRQLLTNRSPSNHENPSQILHYHPDELLQEQESPSSTRLSPLFCDLQSPTKSNRKNLTHSNEQTQSADMLLKQILGKSNSTTTSPVRTESIHSDDSSSNGQTSSKQRSDTYLRTLLNDEVRPQKVLVEAPFVYGTRSKLNQQNFDNPKSSSDTLKTQLSSQLSSNSQNNEPWPSKTKKKQRQNSNSFGSQNSSSIKKIGRPKRDAVEYLLTASGCQTPQSNLSDGSLDALLDSSITMETPQIQNSSIANRRSTQAASIGNINTPHMNNKRSSDQDDPTQTRKYPKLLTQALRDNVKVEYQEFSMNSSSGALGPLRLDTQTLQATIKSEPEMLDELLSNPKSTSSLQTQSSRSLYSMNSSSTENIQPTMQRNLMKTSQSSVFLTKRDAPLYDLLQNLDANRPNESTHYSTATNNNPIEPLEQYLTPVLLQASSMNSAQAKDDYLVSLLSSDPQKPSELTITQAQQNRTSSDNNRIAALAYDLCHGTNNPNSTNVIQSQNSSSSTVPNNQSGDDFLALLENKDFLECLNESSTIDSILSQNSASVIEPLFPASNGKRSEKDEKAISEIYKKLVNSLNPGTNQQSSTTSATPSTSTSNAFESLPMPNSPYNFLSGDFLSTDNAQPSYPPNRTVSSDAVGPAYRQPPSSQQPSKSYPFSSNNNQFPECLSLDLVDNTTYPPNVTLSPMNNNFLPPTPAPTGTTPVMNNSPMMIYSQANPPAAGPIQTTPQQTHTQHHTPTNNGYRPQQPIQGSPYNNFIPTPPNQMPPNYYPMGPQPGMSPVNPNQPHLNKRPNYMHQQQALQHRPMTPMSHQQQQQQQQLQVHMSMNVTLPHMTTNQQQQSQQPQQHSQVVAPVQNMGPQQQSHPMNHRPMMNNYNDYMIGNHTGSSMPSDYQQHQYSTNNPMDMGYGHDLFMQSTGPMNPQTMNQQPMNQQSMHPRHMNMMQQQAPPQTHPHHNQTPMHQPYSNMSVALSATIQQNPHNPNTMMNSPLPPTGSSDCRQPDEITNHMMNCLSFQPAHCNREYVIKQLQSTIHSRQKPVVGKDLTGLPNVNTMGPPLDSSQKGAYFRTQLSSQMPTPPLPNTIRNQPNLQHPGKPT